MEQPPVTRYLVMQLQLLSLRACAGWQVVVRNQALKQVAGSQSKSERTATRGNDVWMHLTASSVMQDSGTGVQSPEGLREVKQSPTPGKDGESG